MANNRMTPRTFLARQIRRLRESTFDPETGRVMTPAGLAKSVIRSESLVKAWESGRRVPQVDDLRRLDEIFDTKELLSEIGKDLVKNERVPEYMDRWREIEAGSTLIRSHHPLLVPGLLQTPDYARAVIESSGRRISNIDKQVQRRMDRQEILAPENDIMFVAVMDEGALYRSIGGPRTMHDQLFKLLEMAKQPNVRINIVPVSVGEYAGLAGNFHIATMDGRGFAWVDDAFGGDVLEHCEDVAVMEHVWEASRDEALSVEQSVELIAKAVERWK
ncbi:helix-turn-helix domain-containing protein [Actinomadura roseirufa]|uniref:helix-turn-helix domain-containing protein n=1 Tax=Actinomadura roseirufa TaxID=2094049 RepID=UPI0010414620|nr:helix-turn-helix transcriptional regulator [Actinomadura roseirufa]